MLIYLAAIDTKEDKSKFELIYNKYNKLMFWAAYGIMHEQQGAEDVVSQSLFKIIDHLDNIKEIESGETKRYIVRIVENTAIDEYRKSHRKKMVQLEEWEVHSSYEEKFKDGMDIISAINSLPLNYSLVFRLKYSEGYSDTEIAEILHISQANVRKRIERGKKKLEIILKERGLWE